MTMANYSHLSQEAFPTSISVCQKVVEELTQVDYVRLVVKVTAGWYQIELHSLKLYSKFHFL